MTTNRTGGLTGHRAAPGRLFGRCVAALFALVVATAADAAVRYWALQGVKTQAGANVSGAFAYDDTANQVTSWILRIESGNGFLPFTFVPGNSTHWVGVEGVPPFLSMYIYAAPGSAFGDHFLRLSFAGPLDGTTASVALLTFDPVTPERVLEAARIKASHPIAYADAFAVATAAAHGAVLLTGDHEITKRPVGCRVEDLDK